MGVLNKKIRRIFLPLFGLFFAIQMIFATTPVMADPDPQTQTTSQSTTNENCYSQLGGIGWLICPVINVSSNAIDAIYGFITDFLEVNPNITSNTESPIYIVWEYVRNITNIIFIAFLLISIYSQVTGLGISNYGVKRILPRIIISALLVNLSFLICALAVDVSNILGVSVYGFFESVRESTVGTTTSATADEITATILGGGLTTAAGVAVAGLTTGQGFIALLFAAIPVILGGLISIIVALICVMLRQGVIALLIMIAPLAFVAYLLPNTEKWFSKWRDLLVRMLVFYPMFAALFGASSLASGAIIASADGNLFWGLVGLAVQILPLFFAWSLLKFSGTILGTVSERLRGLSQPAVNGVKNWSDSHRQAQVARYRSGQAHPIQVARRARQSLDNRRYRRESRTATYQSIQKDRGEIFTQQHMSRRDRRARDTAADTGAITRHLQLQEINNRYKRNQQALEAHTAKRISKRYRAIEQVAGTTGQEGINSILSSAITAQAKASKEALGSYEDLYEQTYVNADIGESLRMAVQSSNPVATRAALDILITRSDHDTVEKLLKEITLEIEGNTPDKIAMQNNLADALLSKPEFGTFKAYGKCIKKSRNKSAAIPDSGMPGFFNYLDFKNPNGEAKRWGVDLDTMLEGDAKTDIAAIQDKAVWETMKKENHIRFTPGQRRTAVFDKPANGDQYNMMLDAHLGANAEWVKGSDRHVLRIANTTEHSAADTLTYARQNITELMKEATTSQITKFNADSFETFMTVMSGNYTVDPSNNITFNNSDPQVRHDNLVAGFQNLLNELPEQFVADLTRNAQAGRLSNMNSEVRSIIDEVLHFERPT